MIELFNLIKQNILLVESLILSLILGLLTTYLIYRIIKKYYFLSGISPLSIIVSAIIRALYFIMPLIYFSFSASLLNFPETFHFLEVFIKILITLAFGLAAVKMLDYIDIWLDRKRSSGKSAVNIGELITRAYLLKRILTVTVIVISIALILLNFSVVQELGKGVLISAGVIGGLLAFAAQKVFSNVFSSLSFIFNKPIKVGDLIAIGSELGNIEKITFNQIHLRSWDLRLIIYPITYFMENAFQNLSYVDQGLRGIVYLFTDYNVDMDQLRQALTQILENSPLWNKKTNALEMIEVTENKIQLRAVVSAKNAGDLWNLRCEVRQKMVKFIQQNSPDIFPKERIRLENRVDSSKDLTREATSLRTI